MFLFKSTALELIQSYYLIKLFDYSSNVFYVTLFTKYSIFFYRVQCSREINNYLLLLYIMHTILYSILNLYLYN